MRRHVASAAILVVLACERAEPNKPAAAGPPRLVDVDALRAVVQEHRGKALLLNFWATW